MHNSNVYHRITCILGLLLVALAGTLVPLRTTVSAQAQSNGIFKVLVGTDAPDANLADNSCDTDPSAAQSCTQRAAIMQANAMPGPNGIIMVAGINRLTIEGADEDAGRTGDLDIIDDLTISIGQNDTLSIIDATNLGDRAFDLRSPNEQPIRVDLLTMIVKGGRAATFGGGIPGGSFVDARVGDSKIQGNIAGDAGGGIYNSGTLRVHDSVVENSRMLPDGSSLRGGAGIFSERSLTLTDVVVRANTSAVKGGGIFAEQTMPVEQSSIIGNHAGSDGGGLYAANVDLSLLNTTVSGNRAKIDVAQHIFSRGGGLAIIRTVGSIRMHNTIVAHNTAFAGGGVYAESAIFQAVSGTIIGNNTLNDCSLAASVTLGAVTNTITGDQSCSFPAAQNKLNIDPGIGPLDQRQSRPDHAPLPGSPALDAVSNIAPPFCAGAKDQYWRTRPVNGNGDGVVRCDIGAVEATANDWEPMPTPTPVPPMPTPFPKPGNSSPTRSQRSTALVTMNKPREIKVSNTKKAIRHVTNGFLGIAL